MSEPRKPSSTNSPPRRRILAAAAIAILCATSVEVACTLFFFWQNGALIYLDRTRTARAEAPIAPDYYKQRLHPYFGFTGQYNLRTGREITNPLGFLQREQLTMPYKPADREYVVVVFGGSVAARTAYAYEGGTSLVEVLRSMPEFSARRPVVINMAQGAGKQPQQLIEFAYLLTLGQHIDMAVNIDGFNEFALGWQNIVAGVDPVLPAYQSMWAISQELSSPTPDSEDYYRLAHQMLGARKSAASHSRIAANARVGLSYAWHVLLAERSQLVLASATAEYESLLKSNRWISAQAKFSLDLRPSKGDHIEYIFDLWLSASHQMRAIAAGNGIKYLHIVQPNQYFSKHPFSERERKVALALPPGHEYVLGVANGYRLVAQRNAILVQNGIVSALALFDDVNEEVYNDPCCHFNSVGETMFAQAVAREIIKAAGGKEGLVQR